MNRGEDERKENFRLRERVGNYQIGLAIATVLGFLGWLLWLTSL